MVKRNKSAGAVIAIENIEGDAYAKLSDLDRWLTEMARQNVGVAQYAVKVIAANLRELQ